MSERDVNFPYPLATRVDERVYSLVRQEALRTGVSESAVLRRVLESWAMFGVHAESYASYKPVNPDEFLRKIPDALKNEFRQILESKVEVDKK